MGKFFFPTDMREKVNDYFQNIYLLPTFTKARKEKKIKYQ